MLEDRYKINASQRSVLEARFYPGPIACFIRGLSLQECACFMP